jgi:large repetitive protein
VGPCLPGFVGCVTFGLCLLTPYHVITATNYICYASGIPPLCPPGLVTPSGVYNVSYSLVWNYTLLTGTIVATSPDFSVNLSGSPTATMLPAVFPNPLLPGVMDANETVLFDVLATGGSGIYTFAWNGLPPGCTSANSSSLSCRPTAGGNYSVNVTLTDSYGLRSTSSNVTFTVNPALSITSFSATPTTLDVGQSTVIQVKVSGGTAPLVYSYPGWAALCLPSNSSSFTCAPLFSGTYVVNVSVIDATLTSVTASTTITVYSAVSFTATMSAAFVSISGAFFPTTTYFNVSPSGGSGIYTYSFSGLPPGCASANTTSLACTPNSSSLTYCGLFVCWGWYNITITITDSLGGSWTNLVPYFLTVTSEPVTIVPYGQRRSNSRGCDRGGA